LSTFEGFGGCKLWAPRILLVATGADHRGKVTAIVDEEDNRLIAELMMQYEADLIIEPHLFVVDCNQPMSQEMKTLRRAIGVIKKYICEVGACVTQSL
jgi:hypothetical protein